MLQGLHECGPYNLAMSSNFANAACLRPNGKYLAPIVATDRWNRQSPKLDVHSREPSASHCRSRPPDRLEILPGTCLSHNGLDCFHIIVALEFDGADIIALDSLVSPGLRPANHLSANSLQARFRDIQVCARDSALCALNVWLPSTSVTSVKA